MQPALDADALKADRQARADEFQEQVQLHIPGLARLGAGEAQDPGRAALDVIGDGQHRADAEFPPAQGILGLVGTDIGGVTHLPDAQRRESRAQPRQRCERLAAQLFRVAGRKEIPRHGHLREGAGIRVEAQVESGIRARRFAQHVEVGGDPLVRRRLGHALEIDRDLDADDIETRQRRRPTAGPHRLGEQVRCRQVRKSKVARYYGHALPLLLVPSLPACPDETGNASHSSYKWTNGHLRADSRITCKEYKLTDCI